MLVVRDSGAPIVDAVLAIVSTLRYYCISIVRSRAHQAPPPTSQITMPTSREPDLNAADQCSSCRKLDLSKPSRAAEARAAKFDVPSCQGRPAQDRPAQASTLPKVDLPSVDVDRLGRAGRRRRLRRCRQLVVLTVEKLAERGRGPRRPRLTTRDRQLARRHRLTPRARVTSGSRGAPDTLVVLVTRRCRSS